MKRELSSQVRDVPSLRTPREDSSDGILVCKSRGSIKSEVMDMHRTFKMLNSNI